MQLKLKLTVLAAIAAAAGAASAQEQVIKIGHVAPLSGPQAHYGKDNENGARMAIEELNARGMTIAGKKVKFELVAEDDAADPKQGTAVAQKLCDAKVAGVVGHLNSGTTIPAAKVYNDCGIPHITGSSTNPALMKPGYNTSFRIIANDNALGAGLASYAADTLKLKTVAIVDDRTAYGQGVAQAFKKTALAKGMKVVDEEFTNDKATDFTAILTKIKARTPDAVFYGGMDAQGAPMLRQMRQLGIAATFLGGDGNCTAEMVKLAGDAMNDKVFCTQAGIPLSMMPGGSEFLSRFKQRFNAEVQLYAPYSYDAASALIEGMKAADSTDPAKYLAAMQKVSFKGVTGNIAFDAKGDIKEGGVSLYGYANGKWEPLK